MSPSDFGNSGSDSQCVARERLQALFEPRESDVQRVSMTQRMKRAAPDPGEDLLERRTLAASLGERRQEHETLLCELELTSAAAS